MTWHVRSIHARGRFAEKYFYFIFGLFFIVFSPFLFFFNVNSSLVDRDFVAQVHVCTGLILVELLLLVLFAL